MPSKKTGAVIHHTPGGDHIDAALEVIQAKREGDDHEIGGSTRALTTDQVLGISVAHGSSSWVLQ